MLTGDYDYLTTPEDGRRTASQIKGAEFIEMKDIGHFPMSENPPMCNHFFAQALDIIEKRMG
jgi:pimeloyl-ACP methyl ester carboxylesterase